MDSLSLDEILFSLFISRIYSDADWQQYLAHFEPDGISNELFQHAVIPHKIKNSYRLTNSVCRRIWGQERTQFTNPDFNISKKIKQLDFFANFLQEVSWATGIVSGCYDLLHLGHLENIRHASEIIHKKQGVLIALILSDRDIRRKKGESRPILNINERLLMMSRVKGVDFIIPLEEPDCLSAIEKIRPAFFFKAKVDMEQEIVRKEVNCVERCGGQVVFFPDARTQILSTTKIIEKIAQKKCSNVFVIIKKTENITIF